MCFMSVSFNKKLILVLNERNTNNGLRSLCRLVGTRLLSDSDLPWTGLLHIYKVPDDVYPSVSSTDRLYKVLIKIPLGGSRIVKVGKEKFKISHRSSYTQKSIAHVGHSGNEYYGSRQRHFLITRFNPKTFDVSGQKHKVGDPTCNQGGCADTAYWAKEKGLYPKLCKCGGLIHADDTDYDEDDLPANSVCDKCGKYHTRRPV